MSQYVHEYFVPITTYMYMFAHQALTETDDQSRVEADQPHHMLQKSERPVQSQEL